jgi:hypothetical protein
VNSYTKREAGVGKKVLSYEIYEGELSNEEYQGWGRLIDYDGNYFIGKFSYGLKDRGIKYNADGSEVIDKTFNFFE